MKQSTLLKVFGSIAVLGLAASIAGLGTFASFTSSTSASQAISSGTVSIALGTAGTAQNRLTVGASNLVPGDTVQRAVDLTSASSDPLGSVTLQTSGSPSNALLTDPNGLTVKLDKCSVAWTESGTAPAYTYTCGGTTSSVLASSAVGGSAVSLAGLAALASGSSTDHLLVTTTLPSAAGNNLQSLSTSITYSFNGTQRAATSK
jgi:predicted ribosomally synthesized peptide with SipW-like signal peptide